MLCIIMGLHELFSGVQTVVAATKDAAIQCSLLPAPPLALHKVNSSHPTVTDVHMGVTDTDDVTTEADDSETDYMVEKDDYVGER